MDAPVAIACLLDDTELERRRSEYLDKAGKLLTGERELTNGLEYRFRIQDDTIALLAEIITLSAFTLGGNAVKCVVANGPAGAPVEVSTCSARVNAELIDLGDEGIVLRRSDGKLLFARYSVIDRLRAPRQGAAYEAGRRMPPTQTARASLKLLSHFPHGLTPEIRAKLLANAGQSEFLMVE
jgi:hypothetical protein